MIHNHSSYGNNKSNDLCNIAPNIICVVNLCWLKSIVIGTRIAIFADINANWYLNHAIGILSILLPPTELYICSWHCLFYFSLKKFTSWFQHNNYFIVSGNLFWCLFFYLIKFLPIYPFLVIAHILIQLIFIKQLNRF